MTTFLKLFSLILETFNEASMIVFFKYLLQTQERKEVQKLLETSERRDTMATLAQQFIEKGIEKGRQEGIETMKLELARTMKAAGEPLEKIQAYTGLNPEAIAAL